MVDIMSKESQDYVPLDLIRKIQEALRSTEEIPKRDCKVIFYGSRADSPQSPEHDVDILIPGHFPEKTRERFAFLISKRLISAGYNYPDIVRLSDTYEDGKGYPVSEDKAREWCNSGKFFHGQNQVFLVEPNNFRKISF